MVIHKSLLTKALGVYISLPNILKSSSNIDHKNMYELGNVKPSEVVAWAKAVKNAPWPKLLRNKQTVTVKLLNI